MSIGFSATDFIALPQFAWAIHQAYRDSANDFTELAWLASGIQSMHAVLSELAILLRKISLSDENKVRLVTI